MRKKKRNLVGIKLPELRIRINYFSEEWNTDNTDQTDLHRDFLKHSSNKKICITIPQSSIKSV